MDKRHLPKKTAETPFGSLTQRIHAAYDGLPERECRIADLLLQRPGDLAAYTATEVAKQADVSNATVSRFFRRLGFENFEEARRSARPLHAQGSPLHMSSRPVSASGFLSEIMRQEIAVLEASLSALNPVTLREIATALTEAQRIRVVGFRNSHAFAQYLTAGLSQLRGDVTLMPAPAQSVAEDLAQLGPGDLVILIGLRRRPEGFSNIVGAAAETGASLLLIADGSIRAAPALATWTLICAVETPQNFDSYVGTMAIIRILILSLARRVRVNGSAHLKRIEALHEKLSDLE